MLRNLDISMRATILRLMLFNCKALSNINYIKY